MIVVAAVVGLAFTVLAVRRTKYDGARHHQVISNALLTYRARGEANASNIVAPQTKVTMMSAQKGGEPFRRRRVTLNMSQGTDKLEVVASSESKYFEAMDEDVLVDCVLIREGGCMYAIPVDQGWVDPDYGTCPGGSDNFATETNLLDTISTASCTSGNSDGVQFDFAEGAQMVNTSFAAMRSESRVLTNSLYSETYGEAGTEPLNDLCNHSWSNDNGYLEITGTKGETVEYVGIAGMVDDADEYMEVTGGDNDDNDFMSVRAALQTASTATFADADADADADEYLEVTGVDGDNDNDFFSVLAALKPVPTATVVDADEYLEVGGDQSTEEDDDADDDEGDVHTHGGGATAEAKPRRVKKAVWAPSGQLRAPKTMFQKGAVWKSSKKKVAAVNKAVNAFKRHGKLGNGKDTTSKDEPYAPGESVVDDKVGYQPAACKNTSVQ